MKKILLVISCISSLYSFSQKISYSGKVVDTSENRPLPNAVVAFMRPSDSVLIKFTRTKEDGSFLLNVKKSRYQVLITYPGYADFVDISADTTREIVSLGTIPLTKRSQLLETVIVQQKIAAIRMKGDTL